MFSGVLKHQASTCAGHLLPGIHGPEKAELIENYLFLLCLAKLLDKFILLILFAHVSYLF